jgi:hypothetical protein
VQVGHAKQIARAWAVEHARQIAHVHGAYLAGSVNWLPDAAEVSATSDVDVNVVFATAEPPAARTKFVYEGLLLEMSPLVVAQVRSAEQVLGDYHLAGGFRTPSMLFDPSGELTALQAVVGREFARPEWVARRREHAAQRVVAGLDSISQAASLPDAVIRWAFAAGVLTHVLLVGALRNPTVRRRYAAVREVLLSRGHGDLYEELLGVLGCAAWSQAQCAQHLALVADMFDAATAVSRSAFIFASDITELARPLAIDGSAELIEAGLHREAAFWLIVTASRCQLLLAAAAQRQFDVGYRALLADVGIPGSSDLASKAGQVKAVLPRVCQVAAEM